MQNGSCHSLVQNLLIFRLEYGVLIAVASSPHNCLLPTCPHVYFVPTRGNHFRSLIRSWLCTGCCLCPECHSLTSLLGKFLSIPQSQHNHCPFQEVTPGPLLPTQQAGALLSCSYNVWRVPLSQPSPHHIETNCLFGLVSPLRIVVWSYSTRYSQGPE